MDLACQRLGLCVYTETQEDNSKSKLFTEMSAAYGRTALKRLILTCPQKKSVEVRQLLKFWVCVSLPGQNKAAAQLRIG